MSDYGRDHAVTCPHCGMKWRTTETTPMLHCKKCNRHFPNPWASPGAGEIKRQIPPKTAR